MAKNYFNRYVWLIDTINRHGHISRKELSDLWEDSPLNETGEELYERTFHNHREAILDTFGIEIKCDRSLGYYIANSDDLEGDGIRQWLLESLSMNNLLNESSDMRDRILFEKIPSSQKWLPVIVNALRDGKAVEITYQSFRRDEPSTFTIHPYCLKLFKRRWYVLGKSEGYPSPWIYALDERMIDVIPLKKALQRPAKFDAADFFSQYFGVVLDDRKASTVRIKVLSDQVKYIESLPFTTRKSSSSVRPNTASSSIIWSPLTTSARKSSATGRTWRSWNRRTSGTRSRMRLPRCIRITDYERFRSD